MITLLVLTILAYSILGKPVGWITKKLKDVDWKALAQDVWSRIIASSSKIGRSACRNALLFYYTLTDGSLSTLEKALLYAGILYIVVPGDLLPRKVLGLLGVMDDVAVAAWIYDKVKKNITPAIELKADMTLDKWFGPVITVGPETTP